VRAERLYLVATSTGRPLHDRGSRRAARHEHEYFNGILAAKSRGVFTGASSSGPARKRPTPADEQKSSSFRRRHGRYQPQLEIYADDVKCTHGATVGQLSDEAIFYLRSRGIPLEKARQMLIYAFAGEIIDRILCEPCAGS